MQKKMNKGRKKREVKRNQGREVPEKSCDECLLCETLQSNQMKQMNKSLEKIRQMVTKHKCVEMRIMTGIQTEHYETAYLKDS